MAIQVECDSCFNGFKTKDENAGRRMRCPECGEPIQIPTRGRRQRPASSRPASSSRSRPGRKKKKQPAGLPPWAFAVGGAAAMLLIGGGVMFMMSGGDSDDAGQPGESSVAETSNDPTMMANDPTRAPVGTTPTSSSADMANAEFDVNSASLPVATNSSTSPTTVSPNGTVQTTSTSSTSLPGGSDPALSSGTNLTGSPGSSPGSTETIPTDGTPQRTEPYANLADLIEAIEPSVVRINIYSKEGGGNGSGYIVDKEGTLVTNRHVIAGATKVTGVFQGDDTEYPITGVYSINEKKDIAILKIECPVEKLNPLAITVEQPRKGTDLVAFGAPLGLDFTASAGILSAIRKATDLAKMGMTGYDGLWFQHTVPISPGNSGGPLVNMMGELIGMNTMQFTIGQNLNFAISAADVMDELNKKSSVKPLQSNLVPALARASSREPSPDAEVEDIAGTEKANEYLAKLEKMQVIMLRAGFDPTQRVTATVRSDVEDSVSRAKIRLAYEAEAFMFVGMKLSSTSGAVGTQAVTITTIVHVYDISGPTPVIYRIWDEEEKVGTVAGRAFLQGVVPDRLRGGIKGHFRKFSGSVNRNRLLEERKKKEAKKAPGTK